MRAVVDGNVSGRLLHKAVGRRVGVGRGSGGLAEGAAEEVDGVAREPEADVCVDGGGDADVGVAEGFLDDDEFDALFQEERRDRVPEITEPDVCRSRALRSRAMKARLRLLRVDRLAQRHSEHVAGLGPVVGDRFAFAALLGPVAFERPHAFGGEGDAAFGGVGLGGESGQASRGGALRSTDALAGDFSTEAQK